MAEHQALAGLYELFRSVDGQISNLTTTVGAQGVAKIIPTFDGSNPKQFKEWTKSIEKHATLTGVVPARIRLIAFQASGGPVSDFLSRYLEAQPNANWDAIKNELRTRFGEVIDQQHAILLLKKVKQKPTEPIQVYAERLLALGEDAFNDDGVMQSQLVGYFIDGLAKDYMKMKVMRANPPTFNEALATATAEQNLRKRFQLRVGNDSTREELSRSSSGSEPMEIDHYRPKPVCRYCKKRGHVIRDCLARKRNESQVNAAASRFPVTPRSEIICYNCGTKGHYARECQKQTNQSKN